MSPEAGELRDRAAALGVGPQAVALMLRRGVASPEAQARLLRPRMSDLRAPHGMAGFDAAIDLLQTAQQKRLRIGVFGDYDVDGVTTTAILTTYLEALGIDVVARAASREGGYGLQVADARALREAGAQVVLTGDCGTSDHEALAWLQGQGIPTAVIDHHQVPERMPPASALLNPHQPGCAFPFKGLCSAGVAFYLCASLRSAIARKTGAALPDPKAWLDLVALGTICDMVPLVDENRILVRYGLSVIASRRRPGLRALLEFAGVGEDDPIDETHLGFRLGPRLNAPGRLGPAEPSLLLLRARSSAEARAMAERVEHFNIHRREHQDAIVREALALLAADPRTPQRQGIVVAGESWLHGIVGIAAAGVVAQYRRPALVLAVDRARGEARGSARTAGDIDVHAALRACAPYLRRFGGHRAAAGVSLDPAQIPALIEAFDAAVADQIRERQLGEPAVEHDGPLPLEAIDEPLLVDLEQLAPYGVGFAPPRFLCEDAVVERVRVLKGRHLSMALRQGRTGFEAIAFGQAAAHPGIAPGDRVAFLFVPLRSSFRGRVRLQLMVETMWPARGF
ncbi:single-stranded-DNA-specific exonuclease RecJ [Nannocystis radixulma]|uniref:Single-stranded-DNA-specific exonuclease RecJ n=1 Tax=Nannocystis radixulma TaxID=2995305 RepID=A0ABT5BBR5_9BACT|nr:single-stranded-DNA-specific exonuclease RecJ [Nannocystis radixulma]MDC0671517.1 single-stranded-DNA-specific exonuclease RecJ [Nannocystis radixulma]